MTISTIDPSTPAETDEVGAGAQQIRDFKNAVRTAFPNVDGLVEAGVGTATGPTAAQFSALFDRLDQLETIGTGDVGSVPIGTIVAWYSPNTLPAGWVLCDGGSYSGFNGPVTTPNLAGRVLVGAISGDPTFGAGNQGGTSGDFTSGDGGDDDITGAINIPDHVIGASNLPEHSHPMFTSYTQSAGAAGDIPVQANRRVAQAWVSGSSVSNNYEMQDDPTQGPSNLGITGNTGQTTPDPLTHPSQDITLTGVAHNHDTTPPFFACDYIMYIGVAP